MVVHPLKCLIQLSKTFQSRQSLFKLPSLPPAPPAPALRLTRSQTSKEDTSNLTESRARPTNAQIRSFLDSMPSLVCVHSNYDPYVRAVVHLLNHQHISAALRLFRHSVHRNINTGGKNVYYSPRTLVTIIHAVVAAKPDCQHKDIAQLNKLAQHIHGTLRQYTEYWNASANQSHPYAVSRAYELLQKYDIDSAPTLMAEQQSLNVQRTQGTHVHLLRSLFREYNSDASDKEGILFDIADALRLMANSDYKLDRRLLSFISSASLQLSEERALVSENLRDAAKRDASENSQRLIAIASAIEKGSKAASASLTSSQLLKSSKSRTVTSSTDYKTHRAITMRRLQLSTDHTNLHTKASNLHHLLRLSLTTPQRKVAFKQAYVHFKSLLEELGSKHHHVSFQPESKPEVAQAKARIVRRRILNSAMSIFQSAIFCNFYIGFRYAIRTFIDLADAGVLQHAHTHEYEHLLRLFWKIAQLSPHWNGRVGMTRVLRVYSDAYEQRGDHDNGDMWRKYLRKNEKLAMKVCVDYMSADLNAYSRINAIKLLLETFEALDCPVREELLARVIKDSELGSKEQLARIIKALNDFAVNKMKRS
ncbi:hypothetical protein E3P99_02388 [Wallemia hederae]|uniref:Uncharacterized protein n=1 Tax=Wallemia hederae TaxID=1540922 RepID=A0A4T0FL03_9BASI|nr:hypothetical protein E3P99_02388 [Wallemia hederae]